MSNYPNNYPGGPGAPPPTSSNSNGTLILVLGILSIVCLPILGPVAWILGNNALKAYPDPTQIGQINAGRICGIIGTVFLVLGIIYWILILTGVATGFLHHPPATPTAPSSAP